MKTQYGPIRFPIRIMLIGLLLPFSLTLSAAFHIISWNFRHLGDSKSDRELLFAASLLQSADVVALQEVVAGPEGARAVARLADLLNRTGRRWEYVVSPSTGSPPGYAECYAFLWKSDRIQLVEAPRLETGLAEHVMREPFTARFRIEGTVVRLVNFHALPWEKGPEREVALLGRFPEVYKGECLLIVGDFNLPPGHPAFDALRRAGYAAAIQQQSTTIQRTVDGDGYLHRPLDNIWYPPGRLRLQSAAVIDFVPALNGNLKLANAISDHLPVRATFH